MTIRSDINDAIHALDDAWNKRDFQYVVDAQEFLKAALRELDNAAKLRDNPEHFVLIADPEEAS